MKKPLKKGLKITGIVLIVLIGILIALPFIFKDKIISRVKTEASAQIHGDINFGDYDLSIFRTFPDLSLRINDLRITGADEFQSDTLFKAGELFLTLDLMSVIRGEKYQIKEISLHTPRIKTIILEDGKANWDIAKSTGTETTTDTESASSFDLRLDKIEITDGYIVYDDRQSGMKAVIHDLDHLSSGNFNETVYNMDTRTTIAELTFIEGGIKMLNKVLVSLDAGLEIDMQNSKYTFRENELKLNELILGFDGFVAMPGEAIDMDVKFNARETEFKNILSLIPAVYMNDFNQVKTAGKLALNGFVKGRMHGEEMPGYHLALKVDNAMFKYPDLPKSVDNIFADVVINNPDGKDDNLLIDIKRFYMEMAGNPLEVKMRIATPVSDPAIDGVIKGKVNLASVKEVIPQEPGEEMNGVIVADIETRGRMSTLDAGRYDKFHLAGQLIFMDMLYKSAESTYDMKIDKAYLNFSPQFVELASFTGIIGNSDLNASGRIDNLLNYYFRDELLAGTFNVKSNKLDLNEFTSDDETGETASGEEATGVIEIPANISFKLLAQAGELLYDDLTLKNVIAELLVKDSRAEIKSLTAELMGGAIGMSGFYDTKNSKQPLIDFNMTVTNFDIQQTVAKFESVKALAPLARYATGKFSSSFKVAGFLDEKMEPVLTSLNGGGKFSTNETIIRGFKAVEKISSTLKLPQFDPMKIQDISPSFKFKDGRVNVDPFKVKMGNITGTIEGSNGIDQTINYIWKLTVPTGSAGAQATGALNELARKNGLPGIQGTGTVPVNILITGTVTDPVVEIKMTEFVADIKDQVKEQIIQKVEEVKEDVKAKAREEADKILRDAQAQADRVKSEARAAADAAKKEGYAAADKVEAEAKNPVAKAAAKKAADKMRQETDQKAKRIVDEGDKKADQIMQDARKRADATLQ